MEQTNILIALGGLLILTLMLASLVRKYQEHMAVKRMQIHRIMRGVNQIDDLLQRTSGCSLPVEISKFILEEALSRYRKVKQIDRRYVGIEGLISEAEQAVDMVREQSSHEIQNYSQLVKITHALGELIGFLRTEMLLQPVTQEKIQAFSDLIGTRRSECVCRFHMTKAKEMRDQGQLRAALEQCNSIKSFLDENGPTNDQVRAWYEEAEEMHGALLGEAQ